MDEYTINIPAHKLRDILNEEKDYYSDSFFDAENKLERARKFSKRKKKNRFFKEF